MNQPTHTPEQRMTGGIGLLIQSTAAACQAISLAADMNLLNVLMLVARGVLDAAIKMVPVDVNMDAQPETVRRLYRAAVVARTAIDETLTSKIEIVGAGAKINGKAIAGTQ